MARARNKLNTKQVAALSDPGRYADGGSLYLAIDGAGAAMRRRWLFMFPWQGKRREMGLGAYPVVSLAEARKGRDEAERVRRAGIDPIANREEARRREAAKPSFGEIADTLLAAKEREWRNAKHREQWRISLQKDAAALRNTPVDEIDTAAVLEVLKTIWTARPETALRLRQRIEAVLDAAKAQGHRTGENPAAWRGHLSHLLPKRASLSHGHHAAMPYSDVPDFMARLRPLNTMAAKALEFAILTAARSGEVYGARWPEIDLMAKVWTVPASRMKAAREHRVPLSDSALAVLRELATAKVGEFVFTGRKQGKPLSHVAMAKVIARLDVENATPHGFRSAFRDWAGNETHFAREVAEAALAHVVGDKAEQAYRRGDALEKRRDMMAAWANYCAPQNTSNVLAFRKSASDPAA